MAHFLAVAGIQQGQRTAPVIAALGQPAGQGGRRNGGRAALQWRGRRTPERNDLRLDPDLEALERARAAGAVLDPDRFQPRFRLQGREEALQFQLRSGQEQVHALARHQHAAQQVGSSGPGFQPRGKRLRVCNGHEMVGGGVEDHARIVAGHARSTAYGSPSRGCSEVSGSAGRAAPGSGPGWRRSRPACPARNPDDAAAGSQRYRPGLAPLRLPGRPWRVRGDRPGR